MKFEIYPMPATGLLNIVNGNQSGWHWRLKASNGEPIASGESYVNKANCLRAIELVKGTTHATPVFEVAG